MMVRGRVFRLTSDRAGECHGNREAAGSVSADRELPQAELAFAHLNLRRNPFGELTADERRDLALVDLSDVESFLAVSITAPLQPAVQILGEKGFGKTTHLLALQKVFPESSYTWIPAERSVPVDVSGTPVLIDEAQRLTWRQRRRLWKQRVPLILATHRNFVRSLRRAGRSVYTFSAARHTNPERICRMANSRIEMVRRTSAPVPAISPAFAARLSLQYGADIRAICQSLYDTFQNLRSVEDVREM